MEFFTGDRVSFDPLQPDGVATHCTDGRNEAYVMSVAGEFLSFPIEQVRLVAHRKLDDEASVGESIDVFVKHRGWVSGIVREIPEHFIIVELPNGDRIRVLQEYIVGECDWYFTKVGPDQFTGKSIAVMSRIRIEANAELK